FTSAVWATEPTWTSAFPGGTGVDFCVMWASSRSHVLRQHHSRLRLNSKIENPPFPPCPSVLSAVNTGMSSKNPRSLFAAIIVNLVLCAGLGAAQLPATLTLQDLVEKPERWPATVKVTANVRTKTGQTVLQGQTVPVLTVTDK